jgi:hypothetical protein
MRPQSEHALPLVPQKFSEALSGCEKHWPLAQHPLGQVLGLHGKGLSTQVKLAPSQRWFIAPQSWQAAPPVPQKLFDALSGGGKHWPPAQQPEQFVASQAPLPPPVPPPPAPPPTLATQSGWPLALVQP